jgi:hypothetical protein
MNYDIESMAREIATRNNCDFYNAALGWLPDADIILRRMGLDARAYEECFIDPQVCAALVRRKAKTLIKKSDIDRSGSDPQIQKAVRKFFNNLKVRRIISEILDCIYWGYQPLEIMWESQEGLLVPKDVIGKPSFWFNFNSNNELILKTKENFVGEKLPPRKFLLAQSDATYENPHGRRIASQIFWYVIFKKNGLKWWITFVEKFGIPFVFGRLPKGYSKPEETDFLNTLCKMVKDAIAVIPENASVELLSLASPISKRGNRDSADRRDDPNARPSAQVARSTSGNAGEQHLKLLNYCDAAISKAFLGHGSGLDSWQGKAGGKNTVQQNLKDLTDADGSLVSGVLDELINLFVEVNYGARMNLAPKPRFVFQSKVFAVDQKKAERDKWLALKCKPQFSKEYFMKEYGFADDEIVVVNPPSNVTTTLSGKSEGIILPPMEIL